MNSTSELLTTMWRAESFKWSEKIAMLHRLKDMDSDFINDDEMELLLMICVKYAQEDYRREYYS